MPTRFPHWWKRIVQAFLTLLCWVPVLAQETMLRPEADLNSGLPSNAIRCLARDAENRLWIGTDNGLAILQADNAACKKITGDIGNASVWGLALLNNEVFVGTRFQGLYIFSRTDGRLIHRYPPAAISLIRKIKVFDKQVFILANGGTYLYSNDQLLPLPVTSKIDSDILIDMFSWNNNIYGLAYPTSEIVLYRDGAFEENAANEIFNGDSLLSAETYFSATTVGNQLILGSGSEPALHLMAVVIEKGVPVKTYSLPGYPDKSYVTWDIAAFGNKVVLAVGDTRNNNDGCLLLLDSRKPGLQKLETDYLSCLMLGKDGNNLYFGGLHKGLFLLRPFSGFQVLDRTAGTTLADDGRHVLEYRTGFIRKLDSSTGSGGRQVEVDNSDLHYKARVLLSGDTLFYFADREVKMYNVSSLRPLTEPGPFRVAVSALERLDSDIFIFPGYGKVLRYDLVRQRLSTLSGVESFIPVPKRFGDIIYLLNQEKGFSIIKKDTAYPLNCSDKSVAFAADFTVVGDSLFTLLRNTLFIYRVDTAHHRLLPGSTVCVDSLIEGFTPLWLISAQRKLYLVNEKGIVLFDPRRGEPVSYYYLGNYLAMGKPVTTVEGIILEAGNFTVSIPFRDIDHPPGTQDGFVLTLPGNVNERLPFYAGIQCADYLFENRFLKKMVITSGDQKVVVRYSIGNGFNFPGGLASGEYRLQVTGERSTMDKIVNIEIPLNRNPYFFIFVAILVMATAFFIIRAQLEKRELQKKLYENRLQILNQNLNPHFVFNSMNLISSLVLEEKYEEAVQVISDFSGLQRTYLEMNNRGEISLREELDFLEAYLNLQQLRFHVDSRFMYSVNIAPEVDAAAVMVPPFILQPLAENAIKYGIIGSPAAKRMIRIDVYGTDPVVISFEDNGPGVVAGMKGLGLGHRLLQERVQLFMKDKNKRVNFLAGLPALFSRGGYRVEIQIY